MNKMKSNFFIIIILIAVSLLSQDYILPADDDNSQKTGTQFFQKNSGKSAELDRKIQELHIIQKQYYDLTNNWNIEKSDFENQISVLENEMELISGQIKTEKSKKNDVEKSIASAKSDLNINGIENNFYPVIFEYINKLDSSIDSGMPFKYNSRKNDIKVLKNSSGDSSLQLSDFFNKFWAILQDEMMSGKKIELYKDVIMIGNAEKMADILKIGRIGLFYKTFDNKSVGAVKFDGKKYFWTDDLSSRDEYEIRNAFDILMKNRTPVFTILPVAGKIKNGYK